MARIPRPNLTGDAFVAKIPVLAAVLAAIAVAGFFVILPDWRLEGLVEASGLPQLLPPAQPPLGITARGLLALGVGGVTGAVLWSALFLLVGPGGLLAPKQDREAGVPIIRRADAHPDAPPRRPMSAAELGTPPAPPRAPAPADVAVLEEPIDDAAGGRRLPANLEQPLAAFDPQAIPDVPREPVRPIRPAPPASAPTERFETFEMTPMVREPQRRPAPVPPPTIEALLQRLEQGTRRPGTSD